MLCNCYVMQKMNDLSNNTCAVTQEFPVTVFKPFLVLSPTLSLQHMLINIDSKIHSTQFSCLLQHVHTAALFLVDWGFTAAPELG